jgi:hypothetical protein
MLFKLKPASVDRVIKTMIPEQVFEIESQTPFKHHSNITSLAGPFPPTLVRTISADKEFRSTVPEFWK